MSLNQCWVQSFDSIVETYGFYSLYSWEKGSGIWYGKGRLIVKRTKCMQEIVCGCVGKAAVENTRSWHCDFPALIRLSRMKDNGWYMAEHWEQHNHSMFPDYGQIIHWPSHKHIYMYSWDLVKQLRHNIVNLAKVYIIVGRFSGSMDNVTFTRRHRRISVGKLAVGKHRTMYRRRWRFSWISAQNIHTSHIALFNKKAWCSTRISVVSLTRTVLERWSIWLLASEFTCPWST